MSPVHQWTANPHPDKVGSPGQNISAEQSLQLNKKWTLRSRHNCVYRARICFCFCRSCRCQVRDTLEILQPTNIAYLSARILRAVGDLLRRLQGLLEEGAATHSETDLRKNEAKVVERKARENPEKTGLAQWPETKDGVHKERKLRVSGVTWATCLDIAGAVTFRKTCDCDLYTPLHPQCGLCSYM